MPILDVRYTLAPRRYQDWDGDEKKMNRFDSNCRTFLRFITSLMLVALVAGCGSGGGSDSQAGTLSVSLTDAPACGFDAVNVTVRKIRIHQSADAQDTAAGWSEIALKPARKINLLDLNNGVLEGLGEMPLDAGRYTQLRLVLVANTAQNIANSVVLTGSPAEIRLVTPSAVQSGIKLVHPFDVAPGQRTDLVLDFDACKSIVTRGNGTYALKPVIKVIPTVLNGIKGFVDTSLLGSNFMVSAQMNGAVVHATVPNALTGEFFLARLTPGNYDVAITADGRAMAVIAAVPVADATSIVTVSASTNPVSPLASAVNSIGGHVTLNPSSVSEEVAFVAAKQTVATGLSVTVKTQPADLLSGGAYNLTLPAGAPLLGQYGSGTLPIALVEQMTVAGQYSVEASATGYLTQSFDKNIAMGNATQDFVLVP
jgi:hypothetical protein